MGNSSSNTAVKGGFVGSNSLVNAYKTKQYDSLFLYYLSMTTTILSCYVVINKKDEAKYKIIVDNCAKNLYLRLQMSGIKSDIIEQIKNHSLSMLPYESDYYKIDKMAMVTAVRDYDHNNVSFSGLSNQDAYNPLEIYCKKLDHDIVENKTVYDNSIVAWGAAGELVQIIPPQVETYNALNGKYNLIFAYDSFSESFGVSSLTSETYSITNLVNHLSKKYPNTSYGNIDEIYVQFIHSADYISTFNQFLMNHMSSLEDEENMGDVFEIYKDEDKDENESILKINDLHKFYEYLQRVFDEGAELIMNKEFTIKDVIGEAHRNGGNVDEFIAKCDDQISTYINVEKDDNSDFDTTLYGKYIKLVFDSGTTINIALIKQDLYPNDLKILTDIILSKHSKNNILLCSVRAVDCACTYFDLVENDNKFSDNYKVIHIAHGRENSGYINTISGTEFVNYINNRKKELENKENNCSNIILNKNKQGINEKLLEKFDKNTQ